MGNLHSVAKSLEAAGASVIVTGDPALARRADRLVLPGQGAFPDAMQELRASGLIDMLEEEVLGRAKPFLGICLGLQLLAHVGVENCDTAGLGWLDARVERMSGSAPHVRLPHIGWNDVHFER